MDRPRLAAQELVRPQATLRLRRTEQDVWCEQVRGIDGWNAARRASQAAAVADGRSRESRLDTARRLDVLRRVQQAVVDRADVHLRAGAPPLRTVAPSRVVLVHRDEWFRNTVGRTLRDAGVRVVGELENGADAVGVAIVEQPDLVVLQDRLPMIGAADVIRWLAEHCENTWCAVQASSTSDFGLFLDTGARTVFSRRVPPADVAHELRRLL